MASSSIVLLLAILSIANAHTWISCSKMVNGVCQGYIRNYVGRNTPTAAVDDYYTWKALGRPDNFTLCKPDSQATATYQSGYPMATANAGDTVNVMYTPNGHSQPGDHGLTTTARIHWTGSTSQVLKTRADLTDANRLAQWNYGSNCATTGDVASLPCVNGFTIPANTPTGTYQFVWYWPYDKDQQQVPIGEEYFSCFDVAVTGTTAVLTSTTQQNPTTQQTSQQTSQQMTSQQTSQQMTSANPATSANPTTTSNTGLCATALDDCKSFCAPAASTVCDCDPATGAKNVKCASDEDNASSAVSIAIAGLSLIFAIFVSF